MRPILLIAGMAVILFIVYRRTHTDQTAMLPARGSDLILQVHSIPVTRSLSLGDFVIPARETHTVKIVVDESVMRNSRVSGTFSTEGSPGIQVVLLDENQYNRFRRNSAPSEYIYLSKTTTAGNIEAAIPRSGTYYLVFDNSASDSSAHVKADVAVLYQIVQVDSGAGQEK